MRSLYCRTLTHLMRLVSHDHELYQLLSVCQDCAYISYPEDRFSEWLLYTESSAGQRPTAKQLGLQRQLAIEIKKAKNSYLAYCSVN